MTNPENASYEPNSTQMPEAYHDDACWELMDDAVVAGSKALAQAAKSGAGEKDAGGSDKDKKEPEPEVKDEEPEVKEEQDQPEIDPELKEQLDKFTEKGLRQMLSKMLGSHSEKYDQQVVAAILNNPSEYNDLRTFVMAERVAYYMKTPSAVATAKLDHPIAQQAIQTYKGLSKRKDQLLAKKYGIIGAAKAYEGQALTQIGDLNKAADGLALAHIKNMYPEQTYEQCFEDFIGMKLASFLIAATNQARSYRQLG